MTEYRLIGSALKNQKRERVAFNYETPGAVTREALWPVFRDWCHNRDYFDPDLIDWHLA